MSGRGPLRETQMQTFSTQLKPSSGAPYGVVTRQSARQMMPPQQTLAPQQMLPPRQTLPPN